MDDPTLLRRYANDRDEDAFAEIVRRHLNLVYFTALRRAHGDAHRAEEIAQAVFTSLARKADRLAQHPTLTGWLFTATQFAAGEAARTEARRIQREQESQAMNDLLSDSARDAAWQQVRPVIDDALAELEARDREAVLLRFFEHRPYAEIGAALRLPENSARMRVDRALDRLRVALARRGVTSTSGALAAALTVPAALAAPAGLATQVSAAALTATAGASTGFLAFFHLMTSAKLVSFSAGVAALLLSGIAVWQYQQLTNARAEIASLRTGETRLHKLVDDLEWRLAAERERSARAAATTSAAGVAGQAAAATTSSAASASPITHDMVEARHARARELAQQGRPAEALEEFLWCFDTGMRQVDGYFLVRYGEVVDEIAQLGKTYPAALDALRQRRDLARQQLMASTTDLAAGKDFGQINRALGEDQATQALFDSLAEDDPRRGFIIESSMNRLIETKRYREFAKAMPYAGLGQAWEQMTQVARSPGLDDNSRATMRRNVVYYAATQAEVRAGAGDLVDASDMIERLLVFDDSPETIATLKQHLDRAGHPELYQP